MHCARFEKVFTVVKVQVEAFCVVTLYSVLVGYQHLRGLCCVHLHPGGSMVLWNIGIGIGIGIVQHYTVSQSGRPWLERWCTVLINSIGNVLSYSVSQKAFVHLSLLLPVLVIHCW